MFNPSRTPSIVIISGLNALLRREPWASNELSQYSGKTVLIKFADKDILHATINSVGSLEFSDAAILPDVILSMPFKDLTELITALRQHGAQGLSKQIHIQGDAGLAQLLDNLSRNLRWDIQADLASVVGDIAAVRITKFMRFAANGVQDNARRLNNNIQEYMLNESGLAVEHAELQVLGNSITGINQRLDRLDRKLGKLSGI